MSSPRQQARNGQSDVEMSDIRLLDEDEDDYSIPFGQSNLTSVLANPDFSRRRYNCRPPMCLLAASDTKAKASFCSATADHGTHSECFVRKLPRLCLIYLL